jgi:hypothetical protein
MNKQIETIRRTRKFLFQLADELTIEQLNEIPPGFNNNIIWNLAHIIAAQQGLCYLRSELKLLVDDEFYQAYKPGTKPAKFVDSKEVEKIKQLSLTTIDQLEKDLQNNLFSGYKPWTTRYGVDLNSIEDAITFLLFHDGLHVGYSMAQRHLV